MTSKGTARRRITDADWDALVGHYRKNPADHAGAAKLISASRVTVKRCWEFGQKNVPGRPPIQQIVTRENFEMRAELADLRRTQEADRAANKKADAEEGALLAQRQVTLRNMRAVGNAGVLVSGKLMGTAMELARSISEDVSNPQRALPLKDRVKYMGELAKFSKTMAEYMAITEKMQRDFDGTPDLTVATVDLGAERALELLQQGTRTFRRFQERVHPDELDDAQKAALAAATESIESDVVAVNALREAPDADVEEVEDLAPPDEYDTTLDDQLLDAGHAILDDIDGYKQTDTARPGPHAYQVKLGNSSNLTGAFYDEQTLLLWVTFNSGKVYRYKDVPRTDVESWEKAPETGRSHGQYFMRQIKDKYACEQV